MSLSVRLCLCVPLHRYQASNAYYDEAGKCRWSWSWYIPEGEQLAGLLSDFKFRHHPGDYPRPNRGLVRWLQGLFFVLPIVATAVCYVVYTAPAVARRNGSVA